MFCDAVGAEPLHFQWERYQIENNIWTEPSHRAVNVTSPNLGFSSITEEDEGIYHCVVTSNDGSTISDNATLFVYGECAIC